MNWKLILIAVAAIGVAIMGWLWLGPSGESALELTILHTNDIHSHYDSFEPWGEPLQGGAARLATAIAAVRDDSEHQRTDPLDQEAQPSLLSRVSSHLLRVHCLAQ